MIKEIEAANLKVRIAFRDLVVKARAKRAQEETDLDEIARNAQELGLDY